MTKGKNFFQRFTGHLSTVLRHRRLVFRYCRVCGLFRQGFTHDFSKFSLAEFSVGVRYFQGDRSPNDIERRENGVSLAWLHHKGRNKHHVEYWVDYRKNDGVFSGQEMPLRYVAESICDRIAASRVYLDKLYTDSSPLTYFNNSLPHYLLHPQTERTFLHYLTLLAEKGEAVCFSQIRSDLQTKK